MARLTLAERLEKAAAKKAKAEQELARLKAQQRKEDARKLMELGALVVKAGLGEWPQEVLHAAFLKIGAELQKK
ncbi:conjugal transfer protein TraD [Nitrospirillum sp. BR 11163]|uniref:conjugal transfer protein TraD n=1 Tax=Nitrospirillum sp. BR 11163 TaxID=3104323 RepID=UPI002B001BFB|nr:conjugal transfer protein TraD [Nitrospirillum sp. BR 11163]MEA1675474.1 conjugal transfer protein TraD [Nitrospirillum sp. BR 11163]